MTRENLGFGSMRLSLADPADQKTIDYDQLEQMVDEFVEGGLTYFDTYFSYRNGTSEAALKRVLVDRYLRISSTPSSTTGWAAEARFLWPTTLADLRERRRV